MENDARDQGEQAFRNRSLGLLKGKEDPHSAFDDIRVLVPNVEGRFKVCLRNRISRPRQSEFSVADTKM